MSPAPLREVLLGRASTPAVLPGAPSTEELLPLVEAASRMPDHANLAPWRLIELRGAARERLGAALVDASGLDGIAAERQAAKPLRAELLLAVIASRQPSIKVPVWEQDAAAAGAAHALVLLLEEAGWGVIWRTGPLTRSAPVHAMHGLAENEELLGWLYVGTRPPEGQGPLVRRPAEATAKLSALDAD